MSKEMKITKEEHLLTSEDKIKWWGYGEWVEEIDLLEFTYEEIECRITRVFAEEPNSKEFHVFGGHLCGYIRIPSNHPFHHKKYEDIPIECHYGLSFGEISVGHWIGFDCGHCNDIIPSTEYLNKTHPLFIEIERKRKELIKNLCSDNAFFNKTYKNIQFCIDECKSIVDQLLEVKNENG